ncbi:MAG: hypothetical protein ACREMS_09570 [Gemmatimonadaceae bacterium]
MIQSSDVSCIAGSGKRDAGSGKAGGRTREARSGKREAGWWNQEAARTPFD